MSAEELANLKTHLSVIRQMKPEDADEEFYKLMLKAKDTFGEQDLQMAFFYYEYANFILSKIEKNIDIFNEGAVPNNEQQEEDELQEIAENFEEGSESEQGAKSENNILVNPTEHLQHQTTNKKGENDEPAENQEEKPIENQANEQAEVPIEEDDEKQICYLNLQSALSLYLNAQDKLKNGEPIPYKDDELLDSIARVRSRLGDLYMFSEEYEKAVEEYRNVMTQQEQRTGSDCKRALAQIHYLIGNSFLYDNKEGCQKIALKEYVKAVNILINHLTLVKGYDISLFEIPTEEQYKVERFAYLPKPHDGDDIIEIKDVITCLLDKIQDTYEQIGVRKTFEEEKKKILEEKQKETFKQVSKETKVVHLGTFGNRKKVPTSQNLQENNHNLDNVAVSQIANGNSTIKQPNHSSKTFQAAE